MAGGLRSLSQIWNRKQNDPEKENPVLNQSETRRNLEKQFSSLNVNSHNRGRNVLSTVNIANVPRDARKLFQAGAVKAHQTFQDVKTTFSVLSQKLKNPTRRRQRLLSGSPYTPAGKGTPQARQLLGRTPTRLYSPFGIETPPNQNQQLLDAVCRQPNLGRARFEPPSVYSPTQAFPSDVKKVRRGVHDFNQAAEKAVRRSLRQQMAAESR